MNRTEIVKRLRAEIAAGRPIIGAGAGTGLSAVCAEKGGADLLIVYNSGRYRMAGRGSAAGVLAYGDANAIVVEMAREVIPVVRDIPVLAGVNGTDPFRQMSRFLPELADLGYSGVQNFPTVGLLEGLFRQNLEETGMGYGLEVDMIALARKLEMFSSPYVFNPAEATAMADAGADMIVAHLGTTNQGFIGAQSVVPMNEAAEMVGAMYEAAIAANPDVLVICHGGPVHGPDEAAFIIKSVPGVAGFYGASSIERLPVEPAIVARVQEFKAIAV